MSFEVGAPYEGGGTVYIFLGAVEGVAGAPRVGRQWLKAEQLASQVIVSLSSTQSVGGDLDLRMPLVKNIFC